MKLTASVLMGFNCTATLFLRQKIAFITFARVRKYVLSQRQDFPRGIRKRELDQLRLIYAKGKGLTTRKMWFCDSRNKLYGKKFL